MRKTLTIAAATTVLLLSACTSAPDPSQSPSAPPHVTLSVPETVVSRSKAELVIDSSGHDGDAQIYVFHEEFGETSTCSDTSVRPVSVQLRGGPQQVSIDTGPPGDLWLIVTGQDFATECGEIQTRALIDTLAEIGPACTTEGGYNCPTAWPEYAVGDEVSYRVGSGVPEVGEVEAVVEWVGPFQTAPEAQASPCPVEPVVATDRITLAYDPDSTGATANGDRAASDTASRRIEVSGVYRLLLSVAETDYTASYVPDCATAPLITIR